MGEDEVGFEGGEEGFGVCGGKRVCRYVRISKHFSHRHTIPQISWLSDSMLPKDL